MLTIPDAKRAWSMLADTIVVPRTEKDYENLVELLDELTDEVGNNESHPLASLMDVIGVLIERYEDEHIPEL